eukprot:Gb_02988 [translate_table: standard]
MSEGKYEYVDPKNLRFTQLTIARHFSPPHNEDELPVVVEKIKRGFDLSKFEPLEVHRDDGITWCEDNRRLYVLRKAGVRRIKVKVKHNTFLSRSQDRDKLRDPDFLPKMRGVESDADESTLPGILASASAALVAGFASWMLFKSSNK